MVNLPIRSFNSGLLTPLIDARSDVEKYASGCRTLENMIPLVYGPAERRPGTKYIADCIDHSVVSRTVGFIYSATIAYVLEFGDELIRVRYNGVQIGDDIVSTYLEADLPQLQFKQSADVLWILHPSYQSRKLTRTTVDTFSLDIIPFNNGPFIPRNDLAVDDGVTIQITGYTIVTATLGVAEAGEFTITSTTDISSLFPTNQRFYVTDSTGNDGPYTVYTATYTSPTLTLVPNEAVATSDNDGEIMVKGASVTLTASDDTFESGHIGGLFKLTHYRVQTDTSGELGHASAPAIIGQAIDVKGNYNFSTQGTWAGTAKIQRLEDGTNWETQKTYPRGKTGRHISYSATEEADNVQYRIYASKASSGTVEAEITLSKSTQDSIFRITAVASATEATATAIVPAPLNAVTIRWAEGAWSEVRGYPTAMTFFEERTVYSGTLSDVAQIWLSETGDYEDFEEGTNAADSYILTLPEPDAVRWLESLEVLVTGTSGGEWRVGAGGSTEGLTPSTKWDVKQQTSYGGKHIQAIKVNESVLFVDYVGRKVREMTFVDDRQKYAAPDMTALAEDVTKGIIIACAYQRNPGSILWCVLGDGTLLSMTYEREQGVVAWAKHFLGGNGAVESIAVIPGVTEDEVWLTVQRTIHGVTKRYLEQMQPRGFGNQEDAWFVDSGITAETPDSINVSYAGYNVRYGDAVYDDGPYSGVV